MHKRSPLDVVTDQEMHRTTSQRMDYLQGKSTSKHHAFLSKLLCRSLLHAQCPSTIV